MTARDDLEAAIRRDLSAAWREGTKPAAFPTARMNTMTARLLKAAEAYALAEYGITADRRKALEDATRHGAR